jgi:hypothetical protein
VSNVEIEGEYQFERQMFGNPTNRGASSVTRPVWS